MIKLSGEDCKLEPASTPPSESRHEKLNACSTDAFLPLRALARTRDLPGQPERPGRARCSTSTSVYESSSRLCCWRRARPSLRLRPGWRLRRSGVAPASPRSSWKRWGCSSATETCPSPCWAAAIGLLQQSRMRLLGVLCGRCQRGMEKIEWFHKERHVTVISLTELHGSCKSCSVKLLVFIHISFPICNIFISLRTTTVH